MKRLVRRILLALCTLAPVSAVAQILPVTDSVSGNMLFAMHAEFAGALKAQGFTYAFTGYTPQTATSLGGFPILGGSVNEITGYGEIICAGDLQYANGSLTMDLRNLQFENSFAGEILTAQIFLNGIPQGRQTVFTSAYDELWGVVPGTIVTQNSYLSCDPAFKSLFLNFFQVPQLASAFTPSSIGFITFTLNLQSM